MCPIVSVHCKGKKRIEYENTRITGEASNYLFFKIDLEGLVPEKFGMERFVARSPHAGAAPTFSGQNVDHIAHNTHCNDLSIILQKAPIYFSQDLGFHSHFPMRWHVMCLIPLID